MYKKIEGGWLRIYLLSNRSSRRVRITEFDESESRPLIHYTHVSLYVKIHEGEESTYLASLP